MTAATLHVTSRHTPAEVAALDQIRGDKSRAHMLRILVREALVTRTAEHRHTIPCTEDISHSPVKVAETPVNGLIITTYKCADCHVEWRVRLPLP